KAMTANTTAKTDMKANNEWDNKSNLFSDSSKDWDADMDMQANPEDLSLKTAREREIAAGSSTNANTSMESGVASRTGGWYYIEPTSAEMNEHHQKLRTLKEKTGIAFDEEYLRMMIAD